MWKLFCCLLYKMFDKVEQNLTQCFFLSFWKDSTSIYVTTKLSPNFLLYLGLWVQKKLNELKRFSLTRPTGITNHTPLPNGTLYQPIEIIQVKKKKWLYFFFYQWEAYNVIICRVLANERPPNKRHLEGSTTHDISRNIAT